jgi:hypothetical protein
VLLLDYEWACSGDGYADEVEFGGEDDDDDKYGY